MEKNKEYKISGTADWIMNTLKTEINRKTSEKRFNLSGKYFNNSEIEIFEKVSFLYSQPNLGPLVKLGVSTKKADGNDDDNKLILRRINGLSYSVHFWFAVFLVVLTLIISIHQIATVGFEKIVILIMPLFGIIYILLIELIALFKISVLRKKMERIIFSKQNSEKKTVGNN
ncbi:hypothetical protein DET49_14011 [Salegentibacter sp. 24]|uniref:hypothetical protein n=1 Tax=Salegentibacter sp. 24 TaxID=2183986 RepID=UPI00105D9EF5|nr:hypothetical protein [Salegentibacter sp. 24]TDN79076.1 hypothetical protein DET49_14011 [Salegentibacter sp. 24]